MAQPQCTGAWHSLVAVLRSAFPGIITICSLYIILGLCQKAVLGWSHSLRPSHKSKIPCGWKILQSPMASTNGINTAWITTARLICLSAAPGMHRMASINIRPQREEKPASGRQLTDGVGGSLSKSGLWWLCLDWILFFYHVVPGWSYFFLLEVTTLEHPTFSEKARSGRSTALWRWDSVGCPTENPTLQTPLNFSHYFMAITFCRITFQHVSIMIIALW